MASGLQQSFNEAEEFKGSLNLGNPNESGDKELFDKDANASGLSSLSDQEMMSKGAEGLRNSEAGQLVQTSEALKIEAISEHKINADNPIYKNSFKIEADPFNEIGGDDIVMGGATSKTNILKTCFDGVDFELDVMRQLILKTDFIDKWGDWQPKTHTVSQAVNKADSQVPVRWLSRFESGALASFGVATAGQLKQDEGTKGEIKEWLAKILNIKIENIDKNISYSTHIKNADTDGSHAGKYVFYNNFTFKFNYRERIQSFKENGEYWETLNEGSEELVEANDCHEKSRICLESGNKTFFNKFVVNRPCWREKITYTCRSEPVNGCSHLEKHGCMLQGSECVKTVASICLQWKRQFMCHGETRELRSSIKDSQMFCLGGDCHTPTIETNDDIHNVAYLAVLNEMKKDMSVDPVCVFKGEGKNCDKCVTNFINCCSSMKGWGRDTRLSRCSGEEKALAMKREKGLCHYVGNYCSKKDPIFRKCLTKTSTYCCFDSKLSRIFQEQGKPQLGLGFGNAEHPDCRGFSVEELARIDFSKFDLEELFGDLIAGAKSKMLKKFPSQIAGQMPTIQRKQQDPSYLTDDEKKEQQRQKEEERKKTDAKEQEAKRQRRLVKEAEFAEIDNRTMSHYKKAEALHPAMIQAITKAKVFPVTGRFHVDKGLLALDSDRVLYTKEQVKIMCNHIAEYRAYFYEYDEMKRLSSESSRLKAQIRSGNY